jgi:ABC-type branched-subunit amino acid transport system substrate-binding protein
MDGNGDNATPQDKDISTVDHSRVDPRDNYDPVKIGFLGVEIGPAKHRKSFRKIYQMAFDEAYEQGRLDRRVELVMHAENGLPRGSAANAVEGFRWLVGEGCIAIAGAYSSDNAIVVAPLAEELKTPLISWAGTEQLMNGYAFRLGNGDCGGDPMLMAQWLRRNGYTRIGVVAENSPNGEEYFRFFRQQCFRNGVQISGLQTVSQSTPDLRPHLEELRATGCQALVHMGYGMLFVHDRFRPALAAIGWDPPRITTTAFMMYISKSEPLEGWHGIDQFCPDNPRVAEFLSRHRERYGEDPAQWPNVFPLITYDTGRVLAEAIALAPVLSGPGIRAGLERIRFMATVTGGPRTHISAAPGDHNLFKGDWLLYAKMEGGIVRYQGLPEFEL